ncbi:MAG TPA: cupin domain-containing protein [Sedimentisphaerales bacterium]|jgi:mannose-6-phosphate isomerase-like protein (cupin superfamily)|nr:cupin domain-containing protein [Sedimentisphaerales bacterium]HNU28819.1 cupin domain-containing protein [Sedimentisphaerales bacterium]
MASAHGAFTLELNQQAEYQRILEGKPQTHGMRSGRVYLEPGKACGQHSTKNHEELLVFLAGQGELLIGDHDRLTVGAGKVAYIPPETLHDVRNTGSEPLAYIYCVAPAAE